MDYRKEFRVEPDAKVKLNKLDPAYTGKHESPDEAKQEIEAYRKSSSSSRPCSTPSTSTRSSSSCRRSTPAARTARSSTCSPRSIRRARASPLQAADPGRARARLSLARSSARAGKGRDRHLQPFALRGRAGHAGPQADRQGDLDGALSAHPRLRGPAGGERNDDPQVLPAHQQGGAARALRPAPRRPEPQLEDQRIRLFRTGAVGRLHRGVRGRDPTRPAPSTRRGT